MIGNTLRGILLAGGALAAAMAPAPAFAQARTYELDIPAMDLGDALRRFARTTREQVVFSGDAVRGRRSAAVRGTFSAREGLERITSGSGLSIAVGSGGIFMLRPAGVGDAGEGEAGGAAADSGSAGGEIVVTGTNIRGVAPTSPVVRLDREYIAQSGRGSVADVIRTLPQNFNGGENVGNVGAGTGNQDQTAASKPNLRGLGTGSTLTLVNGRRLAFNGYQGGADISLVPLAAVDRIEVLTDGASAIYGSDAVAGVVNIVLRNNYSGAETTARLSVPTRGGGFEQTYSQLAGTRWDGGNIVGTYEYYRNEGLEGTERSFSSAVNGGRPISLITPQERHSGFLSINQDLSSGIALFADGLYTHRTSTRTEIGTATAVTEAYRLDQFTVTPGVRASLGRGWEGELFLTYSKDRSRNLSTIAVTGLPNPFLTDYRVMNTTAVVEANARGVLADLPAGPIRLALGGGYRRTDYDQVVRSNGTLAPTATFEGERTSYYGYAEAWLPVLSGAAGAANLLELTAALRAEHFSDFGTTVDPKLGFVLRPGRGVTFRGTWSSAFRAPELFKLYNTPERVLLPLSPAQSGRSTFLLLYNANPDLDPEHADTYSLSAEFGGPGTNLPELRLSAYQIDYRGRIDFPFFPYGVGVANPTLYQEYYLYNPTPAQVAEAIGSAPLNNYSGQAFDPANIAFILDDRQRNITEVTTRGLDFSVQQQWSLGGGSLAALASATLLSQRYRLRADAPAIQRAGTLFNTPRFRGRGGLAWTSETVSSSLFVNYTNGYDNNVSQTQRRVGAWTTVDAQIAFTPRWNGIASGLRFSLTGVNLFDTDPPFVASDSFFVLNNIGYDSTNASPLGRVLIFSLSKSW